ncbi:uncharacterized protein [Drosophila bipectinata]|uniref:uncharacterized protein n=1 Tax=Drosophila bipectinata TaxID=42026 RepID=UPI001C89CBB7|nr:chaperone protein dnaJ 11, chloroplastic [Drosophila bipectinata]
MLKTIQIGTARGHPARCLATYGTRFTHLTKPKAQRVENYYQVLNVPVGSSDQEIKRAFIDLSKKYHPDVSRDTRDSEVFMKICEAYQTLHRQQSRQLYDSRLRMQYKSAVPPDTAFTGRHVSTVWSQYQSAMRNKQMGRNVVKPLIFKSKVPRCKWLPMERSAVDLQCPSGSGGFGEEEARGEEEEQTSNNFHNPTLYAYVTGLFAVSGLVLLDAIGRFRNKSLPEGSNARGSL